MASQVVLPNKSTCTLSTKSRNILPKKAHSTRINNKGCQMIRCQSKNFNNGPEHRFNNKGRDRPWIMNNTGQPILVPKSQELGGDPFSLLLKQRIVFLGGEVNDFIADAIVSQLLLLDSQDPMKDIKFFINSPGMYVTIPFKYIFLI